MATNFLIFDKKLASPFFLIKLVKVNKVPYECATITTGFPVFKYNLLIWLSNTFVAKLFVAK